MANLKAVPVLDAEFEKVLASMPGLTDKQKEELRKAKKAEGRSRRTEEAAILAKRPHAVAGTLQYDDKANKQSMEIRCQVKKGDAICGASRRVFTSDLHQVTSCTGCKDAQRDQKKVERAELLKRFKEAEKASKAAPAPATEPEVTEPSTQEVEA